jgi:hypothetical protein
VTEAEWLACDDPERMLACLGVGASGRKLRLFSVACARRFVHLSQDERSRRAVEVAEQSADGLVTSRKRGSAYRAAKDVALGASHEYQNARHACAYSAHANPWAAASGACGNGQMAAGFSSGRGHDAGLRREEQRPQCLLLCDIFGNPFRPATCDPSCRTSAVTALAQATYDERDEASGHLDPARLAVLSDALEEAGYVDTSLLEHLRSPGPHVRGCFALDLVLGKS